MMPLPAQQLIGKSAKVLIGELRSNTVKIEGVLRDPDVPTWLSDAISLIHGAAVTRELVEVVLDIQALEYANATAWRCLMAWLHLIRNDRKAKYKLRIVSELSCQWQQIGIRTMRILGKDYMLDD